MQFVDEAIDLKQPLSLRPSVEQGASSFRSDAPQRAFLLRLIEHAVIRVRRCVRIQQLDKAGRAWAWLMNINERDRAVGGFTFPQICLLLDLDADWMQDELRRQFGRDVLRRLDDQARLWLAAWRKKWHGEQRSVSAVGVMG